MPNKGANKKEKNYKKNGKALIKVIQLKSFAPF